MAAIGTLRELWRLRRVVRVGIVLAILGALLVSYRVSLGIPPQLESRQYSAGVAEAEVLVDSPKSQVVDLGGGESEDEAESAQIDLLGLTTRARLLASLMSSSPLKDNVASAAGIRPDKLIVVGPAGEETAPRATTGTTVALGDRAANVITLYVDETLPIIVIQVEAPEAATASRLAAAAVSELPAYLDTVAAAENVPDARQLVIEPLGPAASSEIAKGPGQLAAIFVGILILGAWCLAAIVVRRTVDRWTDLERYESALSAEAAAELGLEPVDDERDRNDRAEPDAERERPSERQDLWLTPPAQARARRL